MDKRLSVSSNSRSRAIIVTAKAIVAIEAKQEAQAIGNGRGLT